MDEAGPILVAVDGSQNSDRAVHHAIKLAKLVPGTVLHLLNVQPSVGGVVTMFVPKSNIDSYHRDEGDKALTSAVKICADSGVRAERHISVGRAGPVVSEFAKRLGCRTIVMGTRGHSGIGGVLLGSVAQDVIAHAEVPVCLVK